MIRRTLARLTVSSLVALTLVACQDTDSPLAPLPRNPVPRLSLDAIPQLDQENMSSNTTSATGGSYFGQSFTAGISGELARIYVLITCARDMPDAVLEVYKGKYDFYNTTPGLASNYIEGRIIWDNLVEVRYKSNLSFNFGYRVVSGGGIANNLGDRDEARVYLKYAF